MRRNWPTLLRHFFYRLFRYQTTLCWLVNIWPIVFKSCSRFKLGQSKKESRHLRDHTSCTTGLSQVWLNLLALKILDHSQSLTSFNRNNISCESLISLWICQIPCSLWNWSVTNRFTLEITCMYIEMHIKILHTEPESYLVFYFSWKHGK